MSKLTIYVAKRYEEELALLRKHGVNLNAVFTEAILITAEKYKSPSHQLGGLLPEVTLPAPTIGRIVHYVIAEGASRSEHRPAIVVYPLQGRDNICRILVFGDGITTAYCSGFDAPQDEANHLYGTWHWPERA